MSTVKHLVLILLIFTFNTAFSQDTGTTTIGIITSKNHQDTIKVYATLKDKIHKYEAIIYSVRQQYKWTESGVTNSEPKYYYTHIKYLGQDKKLIPKSITVIKATELK